MSKIDNFPYPTPIPAKILGCSLWSTSVMLGSAESEIVRLIIREITFAEFQPIYDHDTSTSQTDRQTDRQTYTQLALAIPPRLTGLKLDNNILLYYELSAYKDIFSLHCAVIFAIAQLSCLLSFNRGNYSVFTAQCTLVHLRGLGIACRLSIRL